MYVFKDEEKVTVISDEDMRKLLTLFVSEDEALMVTVKGATYIDNERQLEIGDISFDEIEDYL